MKIRPGLIVVKLALTYAAAMLFYHHNLWACGYNPNDSLVEKKQVCEEASGSSWSCDLNRCVISAAAQKIEQQFDQCDALAPEEAANCRVDLAKSITEEETSNPDIDKINREPSRMTKFTSRAGVTLQAAIGTSFLLAGFSGKQGVKCPAMSAKLIGAAGVIQGVGSIIAEMGYSKRSKKLKEKYQGIVDSKDPQSAQIDAFDYLAEEQNNKAKTAGTMSLVNYGASALYAAGVIYATVGLMTEQSPCVAEASSGEGTTPTPSSTPAPTRTLSPPPAGQYNANSGNRYNSLLENFVLFETWNQRIFGNEYKRDMSLTEYEHLKHLSRDISKDKKLFKEVNDILTKANNIIFPTAHAGLLSTLGPGVGGMGVGALIFMGANNLGFMQPVAKLWTTNTGRIIVGSLGAGLSLMAGQAYGKEKRDAKSQRDEILKMKDEFAGRIGFYDCPERDDSTEPQCYCYIQQKQKNLDRQNEPVCVQEFTGRNFVDYGDGTDYNKSPTTDYSNIKVCVDSNGDGDLGCDCGSNCYNPQISKSAIISDNTSTAVVGGLRDAAQIGNGNFNEASLAAGTAGSGAFKLRKKLEDTLEKRASLLEAQGKRGFRFNEEDLGKALSSVNSGLAPEAQNAINNFSPQIGGGVSNPPENLKKAIENALPNGTPVVKGSPSKGRSTASDDFGLLSSVQGKSTVIGGYKGDDQLREEFEVSKNDIHSNRSQNIFKIITNRYHQSGLNRLFE